MDKIYCPWEPATNLFFSSNVPDLVHYSHGVAIFAALAIAITVFMARPHYAVSRMFLFFGLLFTVWTMLDVILWSTNDPAVVMFSWSVQVLLEPVIFCLAFYLIYFFFKNKYPRFRYGVAFFTLLLPLLIFLPTDLTLTGLLLSSCESLEGVLAQYYSYLLNYLFLVLILVFSVRFIPTIKNLQQKKTAIVFTVGLVTFLLAFTSGNILSSFTDDWTISQYGLFAMPVFALMIAYSIVRYEAFGITVVGAKVLVIVLWALVAALLLVVQSPTSQIVAGVTLVFTTVAGIFLVRSVQEEIRQKKFLEKIKRDLEKANVRLQELDKQKSEFVSIASHQLRSPLTAIRGYAAMLSDGSYGPVTAKMAEPLSRIQDSSRLMAESIEDFLNVSRIEGGNMKYELSDFNLRDRAERIVDDLRPEGFKKGLLLLFKQDLTGTGIVHADVGKTEQIIHNLINNALKYTPKGTITVFIHDNPKKKILTVDVLDTGIGMNNDTILSLFEKFTRAKNANSVNIKGTGLGLYVAREMARAMGGDITAHSDGEGKGSRFSFTIPIVL